MDEAALRRQILGHLDKSYGKSEGEEYLEELSEIHGGTGTQSLMVDLALGRPGLPWGRMVEVIGDPGTGKSTFSYHVLVETQRQGGWAILLECEEGVELARLETIGVDVDTRFIMRSPDSYEQCFDMMKDIFLGIRKSGFKGPITVLWDSVAACVTQRKLEKDFGEQDYGRHSAIISDALRKIMPLASKYQVLLVFNNQVSTVIDKYTKTDVGDMRSYGGVGIKFRASVRIHLNKRRSDIEVENGQAVSEDILVKVIKNKIGAPHRETRYTLNFETGIDRREDLLQAAVKIGLVGHTTGAWYSLGDEKFQRSKWPNILRQEWGTIDQAYDQLTKIALEKGLIKPYGEGESDPAPLSRPAGGFQPKRVRPRKLKS